jgi:hypothetical protein
MHFIGWGKGHVQRMIYADAYYILFYNKYLFEHIDNSMALEDKQEQQPTLQ